ncbi:MAG: mnmE 1 [Firmicutes bacterium]|nr:mnmE 1 [Bacillota bacterium]
MKEFAVVGRPNSGKTMFTLNFAGFLNCKKIDITFRSPDGLLNCRHFAIPDAKKELCDSEWHKTRMVQSTILKIPLGKAAISFKLTDTCGVSEEIHSDGAIRKGMAQTLSVLRGCDFIVHIIDVATLSEENLNTRGIDQEIYDYGLAKSRYLLLANKIDLPAGKNNLPKVVGGFNRAKIIPICAINSQGFQEVKAYVSRNI